MLNQSFKIITILVMFGLVLPTSGFAQGEFGAAMPQTIGEAKDFVIGVLSKLPEAVKNVWQEEALPIWQKMWEWFFGFWESTIWPVLESWRDKLLGLLGKEVEKRSSELKKDIKQEIKEEIKETAPAVGNSLWEKFKDLLR